jgi:hypothetical protein
MNLDVRRVTDSYSLLKLQSRIAGELLDTATAQNAFAVLAVPVSSRLFRRSGGRPNWMWGLFGDTLIVVIDGVRTVAQGLELYASAGQPMTQTPFGGINSMVQLTMSNIFNQLLADVGTLPARVFLTGYSYGGAIALALGGQLVAIAGGSTVQVCTFGSPRPGDAGLAGQLTRATVRRWMNADDPIPRFPPRWSEAPALTINAGFPAAYQWSLYVQPNGGVEVNFDGKLTATPLPGTIIPISDLTLSAWLTGVDAFSGEGHALGTYLARLGPVAAQMVGSNPSPTIGSNQEAQAPLSSPQFQRDAAVVAAPALESAQPEVSTMLFVPPLHRPRVIQSFGQYRVDWEGFTICTTKTRSESKTIAKYIFKMCRELGDSNQIYNGSFQAAINVFLVAASNPTGGFSPVLTVT